MAKGSFLVGRCTNCTVSLCEVHAMLLRSTKASPNTYFQDKESLSSNHGIRLHFVVES